jgi:hypothetical protein
MAGCEGAIGGKVAPFAPTQEEGPVDLPDKLSRVGIFEPYEVKTLAEVVGKLACRPAWSAGRDREHLALFVLSVYQEDPGDGDHLLDRCQSAMEL